LRRVGEEKSMTSTRVHTLTAAVSIAIAAALATFPSGVEARSPTSPPADLAVETIYRPACPGAEGEWPEDLGQFRM